MIITEKYFIDRLEIMLNDYEFHSIGCRCPMLTFHAYGGILIRDDSGTIEPFKACKICRLVTSRYFISEGENGPCPCHWMSFGGSEYIGQVARGIVRQWREDNTRYTYIRGKRFFINSKQVVDYLKKRHLVEQHIA